MTGSGSGSSSSSSSSSSSNDEVRLSVEGVVRCRKAAVQSSAVLASGGARFGRKLLQRAVGSTTSYHFLFCSRSIACIFLLLFTIVAVWVLHHFNYTEIVIW